MPTPVHSYHENFDKSLSVTAALPAAAANANCTAIDLGTDQIVEGIRVGIRVPATPALVDAKAITITFQESADNSTFVTAYPAQTITGVATSQGGPATFIAFPLHENSLRYQRVNVAVASGGGDNTGVSYTFGVCD